MELLMVRHHLSNHVRLLHATRTSGKARFSTIPIQSLCIQTHIFLHSFLTLSLYYSLPHSSAHFTSAILTAAIQRIAIHRFEGFGGITSNLRIVHKSVIQGNFVHRLISTGTRILTGARI
jgi:hypothetical protein